MELKTRVQTAYTWKLASKQDKILRLIIGRNEHRLWGPGTHDPDIKVAMQKKTNLMQKKSVLKIFWGVFSNHNYYCMKNILFITWIRSAESRTTL